MLEIFTLLASWLTYDLMGLSPEMKLGTSIHFFIEDTTKILFLLVVMIYVIALARASLNLERRPKPRATRAVLKCLKHQN